MTFRTSENNGADVPSLRAWELIRETYSTVWNNAPRLARAAVIPAGVAILLDRLSVWINPVMSMDLMTDGPGGGAGTMSTMIEQGMGPEMGEFWFFAIIFGLVHMALATGYLVTCHRNVLLGSGSIPPLGFRLGVRELRLFGTIVFFGLISLIVMLPVMLMIVLFTGMEHGEPSAGLSVIIGLLIIVTVIFTAMVQIRLVLALPLAALDMGAGFIDRFKMSWRATRDVVWHLVLALAGANLLLVLILLVPVGILSYIAFTMDAVAIIVLFDVLYEFISIALNATLISLAWRRLETRTLAELK